MIQKINVDNNMIFSKTFLFIYIIGFLLTFFIGINSAVICFKMRWPNNPMTANEVIMNSLMPSILWPIYLPAGMAVYSLNNNNICFFGGKP